MGWSKARMNERTGLCPAATLHQLSSPKENLLLDSLTSKAGQLVKNKLIPVQNSKIRQRASLSWNPMVYPRNVFSQSKLNSLYWNTMVYPLNVLCQSKLI